jgi:hypothetical protein
VVNAQFLAPSVGKRDRNVVYKVVDVLRYPDAANSLDGEARAYAALLQGKVIPTLYGFYQVLGIPWLLALEPVGDAVPEPDTLHEDEGGSPTHSRCWVSPWRYRT